MIKTILYRIVLSSVIFCLFAGLIVSQKIDIFAEDSVPVSIDNPESFYNSLGQSVDDRTLGYYDSDGILHVSEYSDFYKFYLNSSISLFDSNSETNDFIPAYLQCEAASSNFATYYFYNYKSRQTFIVPIAYRLKGDSYYTFCSVWVTISTDTSAHTNLFYYGYDSNELTVPKSDHIRDSYSKMSTGRFYVGDVLHYYGFTGNSVLTSDQLKNFMFYYNPSVNCLVYDADTDIGNDYSVSYYGDLVKYWLFGAVKSVGLSILRSKLSPTSSGFNGWVLTNPSVVNLSVMHAKGLKEENFRTSFTGSEYGGSSPSQGGDSGGGSGGDSGGGSGGDSGGGSGGSSINYTLLLNNIITRLDSVVSNTQTINNSIQNFISVFNNWVKNNSSYNSSVLSDLQSIINVLNDKLQKLIDKDINIDSITNNNGTNFWDALTALFNQLGSILNKLLDSLDYIFDGLLNIVNDLLNKICEWFVSSVEYLFNPSDDIKVQFDSRLASLKEKTGFIGQSVDLLNVVFTELKGGSGVSTQAMEDSAVFTWSNIDLMGTTLIPSGSLDIQQKIDEYGLSDVQSMVRTLGDMFVTVGCIFFVYRKGVKFFGGSI